MSYDSKEYFERFRSQTLVEPDVLPIMRGVEDTSDTDSVEEKFPDGNFPSLRTKFVKTNMYLQKVMRKKTMLECSYVMN